MADEGAPESEGERRVKLPPARSGPKVLLFIIIAACIFLAVIWYATFTVLESRGPDRVVLDQESWQDGTITVVVEDVRSGGEVILSTLNITIRTASNIDLYDGPAGDTVALEGFNLTVSYLDLDHSQSVTKGDKITITTDPQEGVDQLILSTLFLTSDGREWSRMSIPP